MARLTDKICLITGAASNPGLGHAAARRFAEEGATLVLTDIDEAGLKKLRRRNGRTRRHR